MSDDLQKHHRRSIRLKGYDYTQEGMYYVTLLVWQREHLFGEIVAGEMVLNNAGTIIHTTWQDLASRSNFSLDEWIIMPNHLHAILCKGEAPVDYKQKKHVPSDTAPIEPKGTKPGSLGAIIQNFKSISTRKINQVRKASGLPLWQRNYYERIVRNEEELNRIRKYIQENPSRWGLDDDFSLD